MRPGVVTVAEDVSLLQVQRAMISHAVHAVLIVGTRGPVGWITAGGLMPWLGQEPALVVSARDGPAQGVVSEIDLVRLASSA